MDSQSESSHFKEMLRQWEKQQTAAAINERHWSKQQCEKELEETKMKCVFEKAVLHATDAFNAPDNVRGQLFEEFQTSFEKKLRLNERLRDFKIHENNKEQTIRASMHNQTMQTPFKSIMNKIQNKYCKTIFEITKIARHKQDNKEYKLAISLYSRAILQFTDWLTKYQKIFNAFNDIRTYLFRAAANKQYANILSNRADCFWEMGKYSQCLRDLNNIISLCIVKRDPIEDQKAERYFELLPELGGTVWRRVHVWLRIGNSANMINDLCELAGFEMKLDTYTNAATEKLKELVDSGVSKHPSEFTLSKVMNDRYDKQLLKLNKFSIDGWHLLQSKYKNRQLRMRHGHIMVDHHQSVYVFGGTCVEFGGLMICSEYQRKMDDKLRFLKIDIDLNTKQYIYKPLLFPKKMKYCLMGEESIKTSNAKRMVTGCKWKNKLIIFGGYNNPFRNVLLYNFDTQHWSCLNIKSMPKYLSKCDEITKHSAVIINDVMYVFGGEFDTDETNMFCALNLNNKKWKIITKHNPLNIQVINDENIRIPGSRFDHKMWTDNICGKKGSVYIAYGNHYRKGIDHEIHRLDMWRYDIFERKWYEMKLNGNYPVYRGECGFTENKNNGVIMYGGYSSMLMHVSLDSQKYNAYNFFGDCYEYLSKQQKWIMIQSERYPKHRAYAAMCVLKKRNVLCLYGGYYGGNSDETKVYDDIWILDLNALKFSKEMDVSSKSCWYADCQKTRNDIKLFRCKGISIKTEKKCVQFYCSRHCQKKDWIQCHRTLCQRMLI